MTPLLFQSRDERDKRWRELRKTRQVRRGRVLNQQLHPQYVEDFEGPEKRQTGLGNVVYKTFFPVLYTIDEVGGTSGVGWPD